MNFLTDTDQLEDIYGQAIPIAIVKVVQHLTPEYQRWIKASKFCVLSTVGPEGTDGTPRGDDGPVVRIHDESTLLMPDWAGNNRIDSLRNIVRDDRVSLMLMVHGSTTVVRINGRAKITDDAAMRGQFDRKGMQPKTVIVIHVVEAYIQCAKAVMRARLWDAPEVKPDLPTAGDFLKAITGDAKMSAVYDATYEERAKKQFWER